MQSDQKSGAGASGDLARSEVKRHLHEFRESETESHPTLTNYVFLAGVANDGECRVARTLVLEVGMAEWPYIIAACPCTCWHRRGWCSLPQGLRRSPWTKDAVKCRKYDVHVLG